MIRKSVIKDFAIFLVFLLILYFWGINERNFHERFIYYYYLDECKECILVKPQIKEFEEFAAREGKNFILKNINEDENINEMKKLYRENDIEYIILPTIVDVRQEISTIYRGYNEVLSFLMKEQNND